MAENQAISFFEEISKNKKLADEVEKIAKTNLPDEAKAGKILSLAKEHNFNFTAQDLADAGKELSTKISPEELREVSGGKGGLKSGLMAMALLAGGIGATSAATTFETSATGPAGQSNTQPADSNGGTGWGSWSPWRRLASWWTGAQPNNETQQEAEIVKSAGDTTHAQNDETVEQIDAGGDGNLQLDDPRNLGANEPFGSTADKISTVGNDARQVDDIENRGINEQKHSSDKKDSKRDKEPDRGVRKLKDQNKKKQNKKVQNKERQSKSSNDAAVTTITVPLWTAVNGGTEKLGDDFGDVYIPAGTGNDTTLQTSTGRLCRVALDLGPNVKQFGRDLVVYAEYTSDCANAETTLPFQLISEAAAGAAALYGKVALPAAGESKTITISEQGLRNSDGTGDRGELIFELRVQGTPASAGYVAVPLWLALAGGKVTTHDGDIVRIPAGCTSGLLRSDSGRWFTRMSQFPRIENFDFRRGNGADVVITATYPSADAGKTDYLPFDLIPGATKADAAKFERVTLPAAGSTGQYRIRKWGHSRQDGSRGDLIFELSVQNSPGANSNSNAQNSAAQNQLAQNRYQTNPNAQNNSAPNANIVQVVIPLWNVLTTDHFTSHNRTLNFTPGTAYFQPHQLPNGQVLHSVINFGNYATSDSNGNVIVNVTYSNQYAGQTIACPFHLIPGGADDNRTIQLPAANYSAQYPIAGCGFVRPDGSRGDLIFNVSMQ